MSSAIIAVADAVVVALNAADLSQEFTAARAYVPKFDLHATTAIEVAVVPKSDDREMESRGADAADILIDIGIKKKLQNAVDDEIAEIDEMMDLCEEIRPLLNRQRLADVENSICVRIQHEPIYSVEKVDESRMFLTVMTATFRKSITL